jgi:type VI protein secretion system component VasK
MAALIYTANTVAWVLSILLAIAATVVKREAWGLLFMSAMASTSIWGTVLIRLGAPVWPYIAYALILLVFYFEVLVTMGLVEWRRKEARKAKKEGTVHIKKESRRST